MERYIVLVGKECKQEWPEEQRMEYNRPIRGFLRRTYPTVSDNLSWNGSTDEGKGGYGVSPEFKFFDCFLAQEVEELVANHGYTVLTRDQILYSLNLQNILSM